MSKAAVAALAAGLLLLGAGSAYAADGSFSRSPGSGAAGTAISVSSSSACAPDAGFAAPFADVILVDADDDVIAEETFDVSGTGSWGGSIAVPGSAKAGSYTLAAACFEDGDADDPYFEYGDQTFTVTAAQTAPTTAATGAGKTTTTAKAANTPTQVKGKTQARQARPESQVAKPVQAQPAFTG